MKGVYNSYAFIERLILGYVKVVKHNQMQVELLTMPL